MNEYTMSNNYLEIIAGTNNTITREYREAAKNVDESSVKGLGYLKNFITSIENIASKDAVKDERISSSKGNIKSFKGYDNIKTAMSFISKNLYGIEVMKDLNTIYESLEKYQSLYTEGYEKNIRIVVLEYESALYILVTGLSMVMANNMDVVQNGTQIKIQKKNSSTFGIIPKTASDLAKQLADKKHKEYLEEILKGREYVSSSDEIKESVTFMEAGVADTIEIVDSIIKGVGKIGKITVKIASLVKNSLFGIVPLIRSILYLRYKKKADTILALDQQVDFIEKNIEQLQNIKTMDQAQKNEIIKKQKAVCEAYKKKAEKLRAELTEGEKDASVAIKKEDPQIKNTDDDFVLEGVKVQDFFEFTSSALSGKRLTNVLKKRTSNFYGVGPGDKKNSMKRSGVWKTVELPKDVNIQKAVSDTFDDFMKATCKDSIRLQLGNEVGSDDIKERTMSKIGGTPYWPRNKEYPTEGKDPMVMIAQLNFSELPKLAGYPSKGILQFFILDGEYCADHLKAHKVVYHENIVKEDMYLNEIPRTTFDDGEDYLPFNGMYKIIKGTAEQQCLHFGCDQLNEILNPIIEKHFHVQVKSLWDLPEEAYKALSKKIEDTGWGTRIGGNPSFTQWDPRENGEYDTLLFQLDSEKGIMWGDVGIANWFISKKNLQNKNFDKVYFTWDCY